MGEEGARGWTKGQRMAPAQAPVRGAGGEKWHGGRRQLWGVEAEGGSRVWRQKAAPGLPSRHVGSSQHRLNPAGPVSLARGPLGL